MEGKWYFDKSDKTVSTVINGDDLEVCAVSAFDEKAGRYFFGDKSKAHAALLTSAPDLLEALELIYNKIGQHINMNMSDEDIVKIESAIAKARGQ